MRSLACVRLVRRGFVGLDELLRHWTTAGLLALRSLHPVEAWFSQPIGRVPFVQGEFFSAEAKYNHDDGTVGTCAYWRSLASLIALLVLVLQGGVTRY